MDSRCRSRTRYFKDGKIISKEADISGTITAKEGTVENLRVGTNDESYIEIIGNETNAYI